LQARVAQEEVTAAFAERLADTLVVPEFCEPRAQERAVRQFRQVRVRQGFLRFEPSARFGGVDLFQVAERVGDLRSKIRVNGVARFGDWVREGRFQRGSSSCDPGC
jgi:hypothetical protein